MCQCGGASEHGHGLITETPVVQSLHQYIQLDTVKCLNAKKPLNLESVLRAKFSPIPINDSLRSDVDPQLIIKIS